MSTSTTDKNSVFSDKRGQDRRQDAIRARKFKNNRRKADRRTMEFSESPWWLQRRYLNERKPKVRREVKSELEQI
jgi:hypothetical protein